MSPVARQKPPSQPLVDFLNPTAYSGGFDISEGNYALDYTVMMYAAKKQDGTPYGKERLGVMIGFTPINEDGSKAGDRMEKFLSMGSKADQSFAPDPETGKGIVVIPGGAGGSLNNKTNWFIHLNSLFNSGITAEEIGANNLGTIDGLWAHVQSIPEPEDRKGFGGAATGEAEEGEKRTPGKIPVVTEVLEGGKPWDGGGGIPGDEAPAAPVARVAGKIAPKVVAKAPVKAVKAAPVPEPVSDDSSLEEAAQTGVTDVLEKAPNGLPKLQLRIGVLKAVTAKYDGETASNVLTSYFDNDESLNGLLGPLGYKVEGTQIKVA